MASRDEDFQAVEARFQTFVDGLPPELRTLYGSMLHVRTETAFTGRRFVVFRNGASGPKVLDVLTVTDFGADSRNGQWMVLARRGADETLRVGYAPENLFDFPLFMWLPLHGKLRWSGDSSGRGSLAFPVVIRTQSRLHLRERGVVYCETSPVFCKEFDLSLDN